MKSISKDSNKVNLCGLCSELINNSSKAECDGCKHQFHGSCLIFDGNSSNPDLIRLCKYCSCDNQIYTPEKDQSGKQFRKKSFIPTLGGSSIIKSLRSRDIINIFSSPVKMDSDKYTKSTNSINANITANLEKRIQVLEARLTSIEKSPCKYAVSIDNKVAEIERTIIKVSKDFIANL